MRSLAFLFAMSFTLPVMGQTPAARDSGSTAVVIELARRLAYVRIASVQQELKLSDEQKERVAKLPPLAVFGGGGSGGVSTMATAASQWPQVESILKPEQLTRLKQIVWQQSRAAGLANLLIITEARTALSISAEQEMQLRDVSSKLTGDLRRLDRSDRETYAAKTRELRAAADQQVEELLTEEQNTKLKNEILGTAFTGQIPSTWWSGFSQSPGSQAFPGGERGGSVRTLPLALGRGIVSIAMSSLLYSTTIQEELKLTDDQVQKASANPVRGTVRNIDFLTAEQRERLSQLAFQYVNQRYGPLGIMRYRQAVDTLALADEQKRAIEALANEDLAAVKALGNSPAPEKLAAHDRQIDEKLAQILTPEQREKVKQLLGEPFAGTIQPRLRFGGDDRFGGRSAGRSFAVGEVTRRVWSYLSYPDVQKDLKLTAEQTKALPNPVRAFGVSEEEIRKILSAEQATRLSQIQLQLVQRRSGAAYIFRYRDVAEVMKFTPEQESKLVALSRTTTRSAPGEATTPAADPQRQQKVEEILTDEQKATLKGLLGPPFEGEIPAPVPTSGERGPAGVGFQDTRAFEIGAVTLTAGGWLRYAAMREELKLTAEQTAKVVPLVNDRSVTAEAAMTEILTEEQLARLRQFQLQHWQRLRSAVYLFRYREVVQPLALSVEQKQKIEAIARGHNRIGISAQEAESVRTQLNELLTDEQRGKFDELLGKPFTLDMRAILGGGDRSRQDRQPRN